jgi:ubiquinol-cytochrome c reductase cytochrome b subunit
MRILFLLATLACLSCFAADALAADEAQARNLINSLGCKGCHSFEGSGGALGPALDGVGKRLDDQQLEAKLLHPKAANPDTLMPSYGHLSKEDLSALVDFLRHQQ